MPTGPFSVVGVARPSLPPLPLLLLIGKRQNHRSLRLQPSGLFPPNPNCSSSLWALPELRLHQCKACVCLASIRDKAQPGAQAKKVCAKLDGIIQFALAPYLCHQGHGKGRPLDTLPARGLLSNAGYVLIGEIGQEVHIRRISRLLAFLFAGDSDTPKI